MKITLFNKFYLALKHCCMQKVLEKVVVREEIDAEMGKRPY